VGWQKILDNVKAMNAKLELQRTFQESAREINQAIANSAKALPEEAKMFAQIRERVEALDTCGVKEFEDYQKSLLGIVAHGGTRPLPMTPLDKVMEKAKAESQDQPGLKAKLQTYYGFYAAARAINEAVAKTAEAHAAVGQTMEKIRQRIEGLNTFGIQEFEVYQKSLLGIVAGGATHLRPLPMDPLYKAMGRVESEHLKMLKEYYEKLAASCPSEVKPGMVFKRSGEQVFVEITKGPLKPQNADLKGDQAICFTGRVWKDEKAGAEITFDLASLKKMKYLKT
jgi:hypothetical protein